MREFGELAAIDGVSLERKSSNELAKIEDNLDRKTMIPGFEWNEEKAQANLVKHGISFTEAATVFDDLNCLIMDDPQHSISERRFLILGFLL